MSRPGSSLLSVVLVGVLTLGAYTDVLVVGAAVLLVQLLVAAAPPLLGPDRTVVPCPGFVTAAAAGLVATALTVEPGLLSGAEGTSADVVGSADTGTFGGVLPAVAVAVFVALVAQMFRSDGRPHLVLSTSYAVSLGTFSALAVGWVGAAQSLGDAEALAVGAAGLAGGLLVWSIPGDRWLALGLATVAGAAAGAGAVLAVDSQLTPFFGVVVGAATAVFAVLGQVVGQGWSSGRDHAAARWGFPGALAVALAAPVVYVGSQLITVPNL